MRLLLLAAMLVLPASAASAPAPEPAGDMPVIDPTSSPAAECPPISRYHALRRGARPEARKLDELPAADHYKAVYRRIDGCIVPVIADFGPGPNR